VVLRGENYQLVLSRFYENREWREQSRMQLNNIKEVMYRVMIM